jgi:hypothetical protein
MFRGSRLLFIDEDHVMWMARDLGLADSPNGDMEVHLKTPVIEVSRKNRRRRDFSPNDPRDLEALVTALRDDDQLTGMRPDSEAGRAIVWEFAEAYPLKISLADKRPSMRLRARDVNEHSMHVWALGASEHTDGSEHPVLLLEENSGYSASGATMFLRTLAAERWSPGRDMSGYSHRWVNTTDLTLQPDFVIVMDANGPPGREVPARSVGSGFGQLPVVD